MDNNIMKENFKDFYEEIKPLMGDNGYSDDEIDALLTNKVDKVSGKGLSTNDYDNTEKQKVADAVTNTVNNLVNYYTKQDTYTKDEIDTIVTAIKNGRFKAVNSLPTENIDTNTIYLVPSVDPKTNNVKDEYINPSGTSDGYELIGNTGISLDGYITTEALNTTLADYTSTTDLNALLAAKQDKMQYTIMPAASAELEGKIYQYVGATNSVLGLTQSKFYKCINAGKEQRTYLTFRGRTLYTKEIFYTNTYARGYMYSDMSCTELVGTYDHTSSSGTAISCYNNTSWSISDWGFGDYGGVTTIPVYKWQEISVSKSEIDDAQSSESSTYSSEKIENLIPSVPTDISELTDDQGKIPSKTSDLDNDSDYVTINDFLIDNQASENTTYSSEKIESLVSNGSSRTIQDYEGTDMTARTNLQFGQSLSVTDDSENDATIVDEYELTDADIEEILSELPSPLSGSNKGCIPCGKVEAFYRETAPDGYLVCDGTEYAKADYPKLASILLGLTEHTQYEGSDSDHFKVPDLRGEFLRGSGTNSHTNQGDGAAVGEHQDGTEHTFLRNQDSGTMIYSSYGNQETPNNLDTKIITNGKVRGASKTGGDVSTGDPLYYTSRPTNTSVLFCIAYKDIFLTTELPVLFDETGKEYPVGKYVRSDGKWKPVYKKTYITTTPNSIDTQNWMAWFDVSSLNIDTFMGYSGTHTLNNIFGVFPEENWKLSYNYTTGYIQIYQDSNWMKNANATVTIEYTKTSDEWR